MKQKKQLLVLVCLIVVAATAYFIMQAWNASQTTDSSNDDTVSIDLWTRETSEITGISYDYGEETVTLTYDAGNAVWLDETDADFPLDSTYPVAMLDAIEALEATRELTGDDVKLAEYGLEEPAMTITLHAPSSDAATEIVMKIGDQNAVSGQYYFSISGSDSVYMIDATFAAAFQHGMYDMITDEELPYVTLSVVEDITVTYGGNSWNYILKSETTEDEAGNETTTSAWYQYLNDAIEGTVIEEDTLNTYINECLYVYSGGWVDYAATEEELETYGLDTPAAQVTVAYTTEVTTTDDEGNGSTVTGHLQYTLQFGDTAMTNEDGVSYVYATTTATDRVFLMEKNVLDTLQAGISQTA